MPLNNARSVSVGVIILVVAAASFSIVTVTPPATALALYNSGNPTAQEQLVLEYINRARANPIAEGQRLGIDIHEGLEDNAPSCYGPEYVGPRPPLVMNPALLSIAEAHSEDMYNQNYFSHTDPNGTTAFQRMTDAGYDFVNAGENIGAGTDMSAAALEDTLMLDAGYPCRAHRMNLLDIFPNPPVYYEVGIGYYEGQSGQGFITEDFGATGPTPFLTGVVYNDANGDGFYAAGEGIGGVTITPSSGDYYAITSASGGYAFPIPTSGTITVTASGNGFGLVSQTITLTGTNVELDFTPQGQLATATSQTITQSATQTPTQSATQTNTQLTASASTTVTQSQATPQFSQTYTSSTSPLLQTVDFQSSPTVFGEANSPGTITACGSTYTSSQTADACDLNFNATANLPSPSTGWQFDHWSWTGGVACVSDTANPVNCSAYNSGGVLVANYAAQVDILVNPPTMAVVSWGPCSGSEFQNGAAFYSTNFGSAPLFACNVPSGYVFSSWNCSGGIACQSSADPTTIKFMGPGTITLNLQPEQSITNSSVVSTASFASITESFSYTSQPAGTSSVTTTSQTSISTEMTVPAIPGFPWESILAGIMLGMFAIACSRRPR